MRSNRRKVTFAKTATKNELSRTPNLKTRSSKPYHLLVPPPVTLDWSGMADAGAPTFSIPEHFSTPPIIRDKLTTESSSIQEETVKECLPFLKGIADPTRSSFDYNTHGVPRLDRTEHISFLQDALGEFPAGFVSLDASRPWMVYWALMGLSLLGEDVTSYRQSVVETFVPMQNTSGGFGGGQGQYSHCASSYAAILCLALVRGAEAYSIVDRDKMWQWLGRLKQPDGGFQVCEGGEEDVRGAYCAMVIISLLNLPLSLPPEAPARHDGLETFTDGLGDYLSLCQTFEGGVSGAPGNEAHGAYAFCALACLCLMGEPQSILERYLDMPLLLSWLSSRQYAPEGGFSGRTNKLVDGCYSHWVGGCWPLIQAALNGSQCGSELHTTAKVGPLYSREGLTRYILCCCQVSDGGLRDKPSKRPDSYHTCYTLVGLSLIQHVHYYVTEASPANESAPQFAWKCLSSKVTSEANAEVEVYDEVDRLPPIHPLYVIPHEAASRMQAWAEQEG